MEEQKIVYYRDLRIYHLHISVFLYWMDKKWGQDDTCDDKRAVISLQKLCCLYMKPVSFSSHPSKTRSRLKQTGSQQRWDKNLHINASSRDDFENEYLHS